MSKHYRICVCAHFSFNKEKVNGQVIKTKIVAQELDRRLGESQVLKLDTAGGSRNLYRLPFLLFKATRLADNLVILPAHKGIQFMSFILTVFHLFRWQCRVHYSVIGAWLPLYLRRKPFFRYCLHHAIDIIYVETLTMQQSLKSLGFNNVEIMPNCKPLNIVSTLTTNHEPPFRLCTFSRINRLKGMEAAVEAVSEVNRLMGQTIFTIDFFGTIDRGEEEWFETFRNQLPDFAHYRGFIPYDDSVATLKDYFALLFPTLSYTEGVPGTIIDAYAAGLPVICSRWESYKDVVEDNITGMGFAFGETKELTEVLMRIARQPDVIEKMRPACTQRAHSYTPQIAMNVMEERLK